MVCGVFYLAGWYKYGILVSGVSRGGVIEWKLEDVAPAVPLGMLRKRCYAKLISLLSSAQYVPLKTFQKYT